MALRKMVQRLTTSVEDLDREKLEAFRASTESTPTDELVARRRATVAGEVRSVRIVPRAGAPALEVTISDGRGTVTGVFLGRRRIPGISPGRRIVIEGMVGADRRRLMIFNPVYTLC